MAVARGHVAAVEMLLEAGIDCSIRTRIDDHATAEEMAGSEVASFIKNYRRRTESWRPVH